MRSPQQTLGRLKNESIHTFYHRRTGIVNGYESTRHGISIIKICVQMNLETPHFAVGDGFSFRSHRYCSKNGMGNPSTTIIY